MAVRIESQAEPIPGYKLLERLGQGGFGEVWKAEAPGGILKAIKFVYGEIDAAGEDGQRAEQELKSIRRVQTVRHPYILSLERWDIIDGQLIIVMELADRNLWDRFKECRTQGLPGIPREELLGYMAEAAEGLDLMNNVHGLQHLDIKPQNLFLVHNHIKVADFGLVKDLEGMAASVTGGVTPVYAAPETFDQWVSRFSDQYSLAIVYQEMLTGKRPFPGNNVRQLVLQHLQGTPDLTSLAPGERPVIGRALAKNPNERHPTCADMIHALRAAGSEEAARGGNSPDLETDPLPPLTAETAPGAPSGGAGRAADPAPSPTQLRLNAAALLTPAPGGKTASQRPTDWLRGRPATPLAAVATPSPSTPPRPQEGDGVLHPALVVGLGGLGLAVLQRLRETLTLQFGPADLLPHLRLLYLDIDPDAVRAAGRAPGAASLSGAETILARLNRPSHYLKPRDGRPDISSWLDQKMLYRIPRSLLTAGCRALGRLAFCDNYRLIVPKLRAELEACASPEALKSAQRQTHLALRGTRPRVYVVAGLAGGTGGGMFLDVAYVVRDLLRQMDYGEPDVVGLFLLPTAERNPAKPLPPGNAYAALTELCHFQRGGGFSARYLDRAPALVDAGSPFGRAVMLPLPKEDNAAEAGEVLAQGAELLARELTTPLGRAADAARRAAPPRGAEPLCQTFGLYKFAFPRRDLIARVARRLCRTLVAHWMSKDGAPLREAARQWMLEQWPREEYGPEAFIERLQAAAEKALGDAPDALFAGLTRDFAARPKPEPAAVLDTLALLEEQVGPPGEETLADKPCRFRELLRDAGDAVVAEWGHRLAELVVHLIEAPEFRLAGSEEAVRSVVVTLQHYLEHQEPLTRELVGRAADAHARLHALAAALGRPPSPKGKPPPTTAEAVELLRAYPKWRYQSLIIQQVARGLVSLRGLMSDELREVNFCRSRLGELLKAFEDKAGDGPAKEEEAEPASRGAVPGRSLLPRGCATLEGAVDDILAGVTPEQLAALDAKVQAMIRRQFTALVHVCLTPTNMLRNLEIAMQQEAEATVKASMSWADATELFLEQQSGDQAAVDAIAGAFEEAAGELAVYAPEGAAEVCLLAVPEGPSGARFRELAEEALPEAKLLHVTGGDDVLLYRETTCVPLARLPQLGPQGREAYEQLSAVEHFTPHARGDVAFQIVCGA